ncbi:hypothetical protein AB0J86_23225 [Micromonospora sp. NPDC049559]|uniref:hypothetical protein n=1 Tax=Micromonospora sp. NPDC049559 TaxID=3155923 RepID=UPI00342F9435
MSYRRRAAKPSVALWMLVAIGDAALFVAHLGMVALVALASVVTVAVAAAGTLLALRRGVSERQTAPARASLAPRNSFAMRVPVTAGPRRRA